jgi:hypothetical protein
MDEKVCVLNVRKALVGSSDSLMSGKARQTAYTETIQKQSSRFN